MTVPIDVETNIDDWEPSLQTIAQGVMFLISSEKISNMAISA
jgi:hypothetical protein